MRLENVTVFCFFASYFSALALELTQFLRQSVAIKWASLAMTVAGLVAQTIYLFERTRHTDLPPLLGSAHDWLLVSAWLAVVWFLGMKVWDSRLSIGIFVLPLVLVLIGTSRFATDAPNPRVGVSYWGSMLHASLWVFGILGVILAMIVSVMYLLQHHRLKTKRAELPALHLLSLERLNKLNWWLVVISVPLLTLGMASGLWMSYLAQMSNVPISLMNSTFLAFSVIWLGMALLFGWLVVSKHATGRLVAWRTVLACAALLITLLVIKFLSLDGIHTRDLV